MARVETASLPQVEESPAPKTPVGPWTPLPKSLPPRLLSVEDRLARRKGGAL